MVIIKDEGFVVIKMELSPSSFMCGNMFCHVCVTM